MPSYKINSGLEARLEALASAQGKSAETLLSEFLDQALHSPRETETLSLDNLINTIPDYIYVIERETMRILYCNDCFAQIIGLEQRSNAQGKTIFDCFPPAEANYFAVQNRAVFEGENLHIVETVTLSDGIHHVETQKLGLKTPEGNIFALLGVSHDITELENTRRALASMTEQLRASEERYRAISELSADYAFAYQRGADGQFHLEWMTAAFTTITGYAPDDVKLLRDREKLPHPEELENYRQVLAALIEYPQERSLQLRLLRKDGGLRYLSTRFKSVLDSATGQVGVIYGSVRDVTAQTLAEANLAQEQLALQAIMRTSPAGLVVLDANGRINFANDHAEAILGLERSQIIGKSYNDPSWQISDFAGMPVPDEQLPFRQVFITKRAIYNLEIAIKWPDGKRVYLSVSGAPVLDANAEIRFAVLHVEDIGVRLQTEAQIQANLEQEKQLNLLKTRFISTITHELRTPLTIIKTSADLVQRQYDGSALEAVAQRIKKIHNQVDFLKRLTDEVGFIHKQEYVGYMVHWHRFDLVQFVALLLEELEMAYPKMPAIRVAIGEDARYVLLDETLLHHILLNLLSNAIKYTPVEPAVIQLRAERAEGMIVFELIDNGIGIPESDQVRLFQSFNRGSNVGSIGGIGLGLTIVKMAVDSFKGSVEMQSTEGKGCHFFIRLPQDWDSAEGL